ncbi:electron transport complex subunit RsxC [Erwinia sp. MMLR14_017]|uniref:electron transport complex subunit RsxC n=1 Tax=Erwinia sp. MMLR14_017 TaxID=3093842 RepID=UPI00298F51DA|nr:electron transport complex subunit RsxC [Erwinia sp. MMLR14_017]MDW8848068.1 electron transport complex subunit RsxC [Erwinia sp. MMLR14_017]
MRNLLNFFKKEPLWDFAGGIHPPEMKTQSNGTPLRQLPLPAQFIIPIKQHIGHEGELLVSPDDKVLRGEPLTFGRGRMLPVHAPTSGTVEEIGPHMTAHPSALAEMCIFLRPDGEDRWCERHPVADYRQSERSEIVRLIHQAGVAGLGGAGFPTATKLKGGLQGVKTLIINAAECEPYITADDRLMQDCAAEVLEGSRILAWVLQSEQVLIGIEDNKPEAIAALKKALGTATDLQIRVIPTKYPSGGAKQLTKILTGREVPHGGRSTDIGVLMQNVGTAYAVKRAVINGEALTERVVTLTGGSVGKPGNVWGRLGTPISHLLHNADFSPASGQMVVMGGPLMGFTLPTLDVPVVKITNCILAPSASEMGNDEEEKSCIRCSACADVCPAALLPQQLYWYSRGGDHDKAREHNISDCIECGACAYVCPSNIPLVQYYRREKAEIRAIDLEAERTAQAKARFEARQERLEREKLARETRHQQAKRTTSDGENGQVAAALARVKAKKQAELPTGETAAENPVQTAQRSARHAQAMAHDAERQSETEPATRQTGDPRKATVEAAIARARAKKASQDQHESAPQQAISDVKPAATEADAAADPRKAAVAAAVARAKAKKAAQAAEQAEAEPQQATSDVKPAAPEATATEAEPPADPRKAAVAAAIARAKAKKAAQNGEQAEAGPQQATSDVKPAAPEATVTEVEPPADPRKAAVAAAIARAKAKKAAQNGEQAEAEPQQATSDVKPAAPEATVTEVELPADPRKAAVAAAIARAKAKKAAQAAEQAEAEPQQATSDVKPAAPEATANEAEPPADPRKAAVAAAIARAKAKKAAQAAEQAEAEPQQVEPADSAAQQPEAAVKNDSDGSPAASDDPRKAAVAAAIARVKARKAQHSTQED